MSGRTRRTPEPRVGAWTPMSPPPLGRGKAYQRLVDDGLLTVFVTSDDGAWHLSISHTIDGKAGRYPTWDEIADARYRFTPPNATMAMLLPPPGEYVNLHATTFHLWELRNQ